VATDVRETPTVESWQVRGTELLEAAKRLLHEGNVRRVVVKQGDRTIAEFPVTVGVIGAAVAPAVAAIGAMAAILTECTIEVERTEAPAPPARREGAAPADFGGD
jgi:hypothetical protein